MKKFNLGSNKDKIGRQKYSQELMESERKKSKQLINPIQEY